MSAIVFVYALIIGERMFIFTTRWLPERKRPEISRITTRLTPCTRIRVGTTLLRAIAPQVFAPSARRIYAPHGIGAFSLTEKRTKCSIGSRHRYGRTSLRRIEQRSLINERARAADGDPDFSHVIREGLPWSD